MLINDNINTDKRVNFITGDEYRNEIVNDDGKYVGKKPYFIYWPRFGM